MNLYVIERDDWDYDEIISAVVAASDPIDAREAVAQYCNDVGWPSSSADWSQAICREIGTAMAGVEGVVHDSRRHG